MRKVTEIINHTDGTIIPLAHPFTVEQADNLVESEYSDKSVSYSFDPVYINNSCDWD